MTQKTSTNARSSSRPAPANGVPRADTLADVKRKALFTITAPSGAVYTLRALTLDDLAAEEGLPDDLLRVVLLDAHKPGGVSAEISSAVTKRGDDGLAEARKLSSSLLEVRDRIVVAAVAEPKLKPADVKQLDPYDRQMIADFAQRRVNVDASGRQVGADTLDTFRAVCRQLARAQADEGRKQTLLELAEIQ